jgi:hypothetical protein
MDSKERSGVTFTPQTIVGATVVAVGVLLTAGNLGWIEAHNVFHYWPLAIVAFGLSLLTRASDSGSSTTAWGVIGVGAYLTIARLFGFNADLGDLWPLFLIGIGVVMLRRARGRDSSGLSSSDQVPHDFAFWSGVERRIASPVFKRAEFTVVMGGIEVDLREAGTSGEPAVIDVFVVWGGLEIRVPPDWSVSNQIVAIMGGASDKSTGARDAKHRLILRGFVLMGGVEIKV